MVAILASSPTKDITEETPFPTLYACNGFVELLWQLWREDCRCLMIAADPDAYDLNDEMTEFYRDATVRTGLPVACFDLCDRRYPLLSGEELRSYDVVFLAGGHLPTEWKWFEELRLKERLEGFEGVVIGTSAGSMNMAKTVYAWPERPGETTDPDYVLFFEGLGLAETIVLPHYQKVKDSGVDGKRYIQDIACGHSHGRRFLAIPDGSYVLVRDGVETVCGEAYLVSDGQVSPYCRQEERRQFWPAEP